MKLKKSVREQDYAFFVASLERIYPLIWQLLGTEYAEKVAYDFFKKESPDHRLGENFPSFLEKFPNLKNFFYLGDVARLEWIQYLSFSAKRAHSLDCQNLQFLPQEIKDLCFVPHPSLFFFASPYPLEKIWKLQQNPLENVDLHEGCSWSVVVLRGIYVNIFWLNGETYTFFESLSEGYTLEESAEKVLALGDTFDFQEALQLAFSQGFFTAVYTNLVK